MAVHQCAHFSSAPHTWTSNKKDHLISLCNSRQRPHAATLYWMDSGHVHGFWFCQHVAQRTFSAQRQCSFLHRLRHLLWQLPHHLGQQAPDGNHVINYREWIHHFKLSNTGPPTSSSNSTWHWSVRSFVSIPWQGPSTINNGSLTPSHIYEDNAACIVLATTTTNFKPCTKHISIKWHHFQDQIQNGNSSILKVAMDDNIAVIFTKALVKFKFEKLHRRLMGWWWFFFIFISSFLSSRILSYEGGSPSQGSNWLWLHFVQKIQGSRATRECHESLASARIFLHKSHNQCWKKSLR